MIRRTRVPRSTDVRLTFTLPVDVPPGPVSVVGSFNGWTPGAHALRKRGSGYAAPRSSYRPAPTSISATSPRRDTGSTTRTPTR